MRGKKMAETHMLTSCILSQFMYEAHGYRFVFFMGIMIQAVGLIFCFLFMEEVSTIAN